MSLLFAALLVGCRPPGPPADPNAASGELLLMHTNDLHCHFQPERADWLDGEPEIGGFAELDGWVRGLRAEGTPSLLLDGGDVLTGTPLAEIEVNGARGGAMLQMMGEVGYDAWVLGNHEFDQGYDNAAAMVAAAPMPTVSSNLAAHDGGVAIPGLKPSVVLEAGALRVGVIGGTTEGLTHLAPLDVNERLVVKDLAEAVRAEIAALAPRTDLIVVLTHVGVDGDRELARAVDGIDLIVGGHSHTRLEEPVQEGDTWIVQAGSYGRSLGVTRIGVVDGRVDAFEGELVHMRPGEAPAAAGPELLALIDDYAARIDARFGQVVGEAAATLGRDYHHESDLGNWVSDVLRAQTGADVALYNAGGLRADLLAGPITRDALFQILPFSNQVVVFELTGAELAAILTSNAWTDIRENSAAMQVSGAKISYRADGDRPEVVSMEVGGAPLDPAATYSVVSNSYVVERADRYLKDAKPQGARSVGDSVYELVAEAVEASGRVELPERGRCVRVD